MLVAQEIDSAKAPGSTIDVNHVHEELTMGRASKTGPAMKAGRNAMNSADWRKDAPSVPTMADAANKVVTTKCETVSAKSLPLRDNTLVIETGDSISPVDYRRPNKDLSPWETLKSAPATKTRFTPEETLEVTQIKVTGLNPIAVVDSDGRMIKLSTSFALDVTPVEKAYISSGESSPLSLGELKVAKNPHRLRRSSEEMDIDDTRRVLKLATIPRSVSTTPEYLSPNSGTRYGRMLKEREAAALMDADPAIDRIGGVEAGSPHRPRQVDQAARDRFRLMLERLNQFDPLASEGGRNQGPVAALRAGDPAIIAARVKSSRNASTPPLHEELDALYQHQVGWYHANGKKVSEDSGYASTETTHVRGNSSSDSNAIDRNPSDSKHDSSLESPSKKLNPKAHEFKATGNDLPAVAPPRMHISTLSSSTDSSTQYPPPFFGPAPEHSPPFSNYGPVNGLGHFAPVPLQTAQMNNLFGPGPMLPSMLPMNSYPGPATPPFHRFGAFQPGPMPTVTPPPMFNGYPTPPPLSNGYPFNCGPSGCPPLPYQPQHQPMSIPAPQPYNAPSQQPFVGPYGPPVMAPPAMGAQPFSHPMGGPAMSFPPPAGPMMPQLPNPIGGGPVHFPVTRKPRDHDPIKQQQYEAYLEHRKMCEPGYHHAARTRQANRFARQRVGA